jgi:hypothetical protein
MQTACRIAFKEWSAVCAALGAGRQVVIARKGGIHEGREGFRVAHREFWLYPTWLHQGPDELTAEGRQFLQAAEQERPAEGTIRLEHYCSVEEVVEVRNAGALSSLAGLHVWSPRTIDARFQYRQPGLFLLIARVYRADQSCELVDSPHFAGCRSWVELPKELSTGGLAPVLAEAEFQSAHDAVRRALADVRLA